MHSAYATYIACLFIDFGSLPCRRALNLELLQKYGKGAWLGHCEEAEQLHKLLQRRYEQVQNKIQVINAARAQEQGEGGARLRDLEAQLAILIARDFELQVATTRLANEVQLLRRQAETTCVVRAHHGMLVYAYHLQPFAPTGGPHDGFATYEGWALCVGSVINLVTMP